MNSVKAIFLSVTVHGLLAALICLFLGGGDKNDREARLDVSSLELSLSDKEADAPARIAPSVPKSRRPPPHRPAPAENPLSSPEGTVRMDFAPAVDTRPADIDPPETVVMETPEFQVAEESESEVPPVENAAPKQARVRSPADMVSSIKPDYPSGSRRRGEEGSVMLEISVGADGCVFSVRIIKSSGFAELDGAAEKAAKKARFRPAVSGGVAVSSAAALTFTFKLK